MIEIWGFDCGNFSLWEYFPQCRTCRERTAFGNINIILFLHLWTLLLVALKLQAMELEQKRLFDTVTFINEEIFNLRDREEEMHELNKSTNSPMVVFSFLYLLVCLSVAGLQFWHLKTFFEKKKLI